MPHRPQQEKNTDKPSTSKFVLIGEDDIDDEELLKELFAATDSSFTLAFLNNGRQVITYLATLPRNQLPCLILLDYNMPELNGAEILNQLKRIDKYAGIPKIIWSTSQNDTYRQKCIDAGADDYITKPSTVTDLVKAIQYMLSFC